MYIDLIGVPLKYGSGKEGAEKGPSALRDNNIVSIIRDTGHKVYDLGDLNVPKASEREKFKDHPKLKFLSQISEVNTNLAHKIYLSLKGGGFPLVIGGDHSLGLGSISGASKYFDELAVIWVDAHGDINTHETSPTGNIHGMPLAAAMGLGHSDLTNIYYESQKVKPENVYIIGARDIDPGELEMANQYNINLYTMDTIKEEGLENILSTIIGKIKSSNVDGVHLSFDIDSLDSSIVPGTGTPVESGLDFDDAREVFTRILKEKFVTSMDFVELNPLLDEPDSRTTKVTMDILKHVFSQL